MVVAWLGIGKLVICSVVGFTRATWATKALAIQRLPSGPAAIEVGAQYLRIISWSFLASGVIYDHMYIFGPDRDLIVDHAFLLGDDRIPAVCALSRLRLHEILLGAAQRAGAEVRLGLTVSEMNQEEDGVGVVFSNGEAESFDLGEDAQQRG